MRDAIVVPGLMIDDQLEVVAECLRNSGSPATPGGADIAPHGIEQLMHGMPSVTSIGSDMNGGSSSALRRRAALLQFA